MKVITTAVLVLMASMLSLTSFGSKCVTVDDKVYCEQEQKVKIGGVDLTIKNPAALLRAAKKSKGSLKRTGLYDDYHYVPVVEELASQVDMGYREFIQYMVVNWDSPDRNPFRSLWELEMVYERIPEEYKGASITAIVNQIVDEVERSLGGV